MAHLTTQTLAKAPADGLFDVVTQIDRFQDFVPGVRESRVDNIVMRDDMLEVVGSVKIAMRYFSGWVTAKTVATPSLREARIEMVKGPFQIARGTLTFYPTEMEGETVAKLEVDYATPIAIYSSLMEKNKERGFELIMGVFSRRYHETSASG